MDKPEIRNYLRESGIGVVTTKMVDVLHYLMENPGATGYEIHTQACIPENSVYRILKTFKSKGFVDQKNHPVGVFRGADNWQTRYKRQLILPEAIMEKELPPSTYQYAHMAAFYAKFPNPSALDSIRTALVNDPQKLQEAVWEAQNLLALFAIIGGNLTNWEFMKGQIQWPQ